MPKLRTGTGTQTVNAERLRRVYAAAPDVMHLLAEYEALQATLAGQQDSYERAVAVANAACDLSVRHGMSEYETAAWGKLTKAIAAWKGAR